MLYPKQTIHIIAIALTAAAFATVVCSALPINILFEIKIPFIILFAANKLIQLIIEFCTMLLTTAICFKAVMKSKYQIVRSIKLSFFAAAFCLILIFIPLDSTVCAFIKRVIVYGTFTLITICTDISDCSSVKKTLSQADPKLWSALRLIIPILYAAAIAAGYFITKTAS